MKTDKLKIKIVRYGYTAKIPIDFDYLQKWKSAFFDIVSIEHNKYISNSKELFNNIIADAQIERDMQNINGADVIVVITEYGLEGSFYLRPLKNNNIVITTYEVDKLLHKNNIPLENFILGNIYRAAILRKANLHKDIDQYGVPKIFHGDYHLCLFDFNRDIEGIIYTFDKLRICEKCLETISKSQIHQGLILKITKELDKIKKPLFYRIEAKIKKHPIIALELAFLASVVASLLANLITMCFNRGQ